MGFLGSSVVKNTPASAGDAGLIPGGEKTLLPKKKKQKKNTLTCYFLVKVKVSITQLCQTLWDPMDCSPSGSSLHGVLQARILE